MTGVLHFQIQAVDAMRVGDGSLAVSRGGLVHDLVRHRNRRPLIPGSTVKGVVRNLVEALGGGCDLDGSCSPLCIACSLFGTIEGQTWRGRVGFDDALAPQKIKLAVLRLPRAFSPRKAVGRRVYGPASPGAAETMPHFAVLSGAIFEARMHFINLDEGEFGLLLSALGVGKGFCPRFGGGRYHGLGRGKVVPARLVLRGLRPPLRQVLAGPVLKEHLQANLGRAYLADGSDAVLKVLRETQGMRR